MNADSSRRGWSPAGVVLALLFLYILSYGPMSKLYYESSSDLFDLSFELFYLPILIAYDNTPLDDAIDWYEDLWD